MNIFKFFQHSTTKYPNNTSLVIDGKHFTYQEISDEAGKIAFCLDQFKHSKIGIFAYRSLSAFTGILATLQAGNTYVPLNPKFPKARNKAIIELSGSKILIIDNNYLDKLDFLNDLTSQDLILIFPETLIDNIPASLSRNYKIYTKDTLLELKKGIQEVDKDQIAYIMFTSGSTGIPKGVPVSHGNVTAYVSYLQQRYNVKPEDRFSQTFDITFDLSVHDMFLSWNGAAALYCLPEKVLMAPAKFIKENELTMWFSVPSLAQFLAKFRMLKANSFPTLRLSLFCGEPLPKTIASTWQKAAPNSILENIYGPTEATIGITHYRLPFEETKILEKNGVVTIGTIFKDQKFCLINHYGERTESEGELCLAGSQVTTGYWNNIEKTKEQYFTFADSNELWYKT